MNSRTLSMIACSDRLCLPRGPVPRSSRLNPCMLKGGFPMRTKFFLYFLALLTAALFLLTGCGEKQPEHIHKWDPANCRRGELCLICGKTQGDTQDHKWGPTNCTRGEYCASCGGTQGEALGHDWADATCDVAKRCARCGLTEGTSLGGHVSNGSGNCSRCGEEVNSVAKINAHCDISLLSYTDPRPLVYDGVIFEFPLNSDWTGYPTEFVICDQSGAEVARGNWPPNPPEVLGKSENGKWIRNRKTCTEFVPLEPGEYIATFYFYDRVTTDTSPDVTEDSVCIPAGEFKTGRCTLIVK